MATVLTSNKVKIAKRVIEVLEYFGAGHCNVTVMDIVRRYGRPQSSTSELLTSLAEIGLLYKNAASRSYAPTPRLAALGKAAQPDILRNGRLYAFMDHLAQSTRYGVALCGMVGLYTQVFRWSGGDDCLVQDLDCGASAVINSSAAGLLLLSTLGLSQTRKVLWRLHAEVPEAKRFDYKELSLRATNFGRRGFATGESGFVASAKIASVLLPHGADERPLALGVLYPADRTVDEDALVATLGYGISQCVAGEPTGLTRLQN